MKFYIPAIMAMMIFSAAPALAQADAPATLGAAPEASAQENSPSQAPVLPDLAPDVLTDEPAEKETGSAPVNDGASTISPSFQPLLKGREPRKHNGKTAEEIFTTLPAAVQDQILQESQKVFTECNHYNLYSQFHDCECLGATYFEERVFVPETTKDVLMGKIAGECTSEPGVAAYAQQKCLSSIGLFFGGKNLDNFCRCYALSYAQHYKDNPVPDFRHLRNISSKADQDCMKKLPLNEIFVEPPE